MEQIFEFLIFLGNMSKFYTKLGNVQNFGHPAIFSKKSKIQKSVPLIFRYHVEVQLDQISAS